MHSDRPEIFSLNTEEGRSFFEKLKKEHPEMKVISDCSEACRERHLLGDPSMVKDPSGISVPACLDTDGVWVYFPWKNVLVHTLAEDDFRQVRLSRNFDLITRDEADRLKDIKVAIAGLNVGNPGAICMVQEGVGGSFVFADNDALGLSNLNRFRAGLADMNVNKAVLSARQAYEINPFIDIRVYENGVSPSNLDEFLSGANVLIEEMDALPLKIQIRKRAKGLNIPVVMVTGNGHDLVLDIERYDLDPELEILSGKLKKGVIDAIGVGPKNFDEKIALARDFMGREYLCERLVDSFDKVGRSLIGIPQLAEATFLRGAVLTHAVRAIALGDPRVSSGRYAFGLSALFSKRM